MRWLLTGATGALGTVFAQVIEARGQTVVTAARTGATANFDIADLDALGDALKEWKPDGVINCAAIVDLAQCEADPGAAYAVNARPLSLLAGWSAASGRPLVQISTDQFFAGEDADAPHDEDAPVVFCNEYGRTKFAGEAFALTSPHALVVRTNMTSARPGRGKASIAAWAFAQLEARAPMTLFDDYYASTIDAPALAEAVLDLAARGATGRLNVAAREVFSKYELVHALAAAADIPLDWAKAGSGAALAPPRTLSAGLDVRRAETLLGRALPDLDTVARSLVAQWRTRP